MDAGEHSYLWTGYGVWAAGGGDGGGAGAKPALTSGPLALEGTVKTYRYVDDDEQAANAPPVPGKPGVPPPPQPAAGGHGGMQ